MDLSFSCAPTLYLPYVSVIPFHPLLFPSHLQLGRYVHCFPYTLIIQYGRTGSFARSHGSWGTLRIFRSKFVCLEVMLLR